MTRVVFTANLRRHLECPAVDVRAKTVREALDAVFRDNEPLRGYIVDDQQRLRQHVMVFVDGQPVRDRVCLHDPVRESSEVYVMQALSGG